MATSLKTVREAKIRTVAAGRDVPAGVSGPVISSGGFADPKLLSTGRLARDTRLLNYPRLTLAFERTLTGVLRGAVSLARYGLLR